MKKRDPRLPRVCAEVIRSWHVRLGRISRPANMDDERFREYWSRVEHYKDADLSDRESQAGIANEQRSGIFEWFYGASVSAELWKAATHDYGCFEHGHPKHLGEVAQWAIEGLESESGRETLYASTVPELLAHAQDYYADVVAGSGPGLGGLNALLSCSLERHPWGGKQGAYTTLLRAELLGLRLVTIGERADDLVDAIRRNDIEVTSAIAEPVS